MRCACRKGVRVRVNSSVFTWTALRGALTSTAKTSSIRPTSDEGSRSKLPFEPAASTGGRVVMSLSQSRGGASVGVVHAALHIVEFADDVLHLICPTHASCSRWSVHRGELRRGDGGPPTSHEDSTQLITLLGDPRFRGPQAYVETGKAGVVKGGKSTRQ